MRDRAWVAALCALAGVTVTACAGLVTELPDGPTAGDAGSPATGCVPVSMTGTEPFPDAMTATEPTPDAMTGSEPTPDAMTNYY